MFGRGGRGNSHVRIFYSGKTIGPSNINDFTLRTHFVNDFMLGLEVGGGGEGVKPNPNIVRIVNTTDIYGPSLRSLALERFFGVGGLFCLCECVTFKSDIYSI